MGTAPSIELCRGKSILQKSSREGVQCNHGGSVRRARVRLDSCLLSTYLLPADVRGSGLDYPNREGEWPFFPSTTSSTTGGYLPDLTRPNPAYFAYVDRLISLANSLNITLVLVPTWGRYVNGGYYGGPILFESDTAYSYCRFLGERYPFHPWMLGGDSNRFWNPRFNAARHAGEDLRKLEITDYGAITEAMAKGVMDGEKAAMASIDANVAKMAKDYTTFITYHSAQREFGVFLMQDL